MQTKLIAATIATTTAAMQLPITSSNMLAQTQEAAITSGVNTECHGTYAF